MDKLKKVNEYWKQITGIIAILVFFWGIFMYLNTILGTLKTTQQMALKSVIWNDNIPLAERTSACDVYLGAGYNSLTKKHCELIINNSIKDDFK